MNDAIMAMAATAQLSKSGWDSLNSEMKAYLSDVVMGSLPKDYIIDLTISICGIRADGRTPNYNFETIGNKIILTDETKREMSNNNGVISVQTESPAENEILVTSSDTSPSQLKKPRLEPSFSESHVKDLVNEMLKANNNNNQDQIKTEANNISPNNLVRSQSDNTQNSSKNNENNNNNNSLNLLLMNSLTSLQNSTENNTTTTNLPSTINFLGSPLNLLQSNQKTTTAVEDNTENNTNNSQVIRSIKIEDPNQPPPIGPGPYRRRHIWMCSVCGVKKPTKQQVDMHTAVHTDLRPYKCGYPFCGKAFKTKLVLQRHQQCHEDKLERTLKNKLKNLAKSQQKHQQQQQQQQIESSLTVPDFSAANNLNISAASDLLQNFYGNEENIIPGPNNNNNNGNIVHPSILENEK